MEGWGAVFVHSPTTHTGRTIRRRWEDIRRWRVHLGVGRGVECGKYPSFFFSVLVGLYLLWAILFGGVWFGVEELDVVFVTKEPAILVYVS